MNERVMENVSSLSFPIPFSLTQCASCLENMHAHACVHTRGVEGAQNIKSLSSLTADIHSNSDNGKTWIRA